jgi:hypothetical protein
MDALNRRLLSDWETLLDKDEASFTKRLDKLMDDFGVSPDKRKLYGKLLKLKIMQHARRNADIPFNLGLDLSALDNGGFDTTMQGTSILFYADHKTLVHIREVLLAQFPEWVKTFSRSPYLRAYPKRAARSHAKFADAVRYRSAYRDFLAGEQTWWTKAHTKEIEPYSLVMAFFNHANRKKRFGSGEARQLETVEEIDDFFATHNRAPSASPKAPFLEYQLGKWIMNMKQAKKFYDEGKRLGKPQKKGTGINKWYPAILVAICKSDRIPNDTLEVRSV